MNCCCGKCKELKEPYVQPVTVSYPTWVHTITDGNTRPFVDAVYPSGTIANGAVLSGHVRQNVMTANYPYTPITAEEPEIPMWSN